MTSEPGEPIDIALKGLSNQIHAINEALERALNIFVDDDADENERVVAINEIKMAREVTSKLDLALYAATIRPKT